MNVIRPLAETKDTVTLTRADYEGLLEALEDAEDIATLKAAEAEEARVGKEAYRAEAVPGELVMRLIEGEHPVRVWREHRGLTAKALAEKAGVSAAYLSEIESGKKPGSLDAMAKIARALGVQVDDLVVWERVDDKQQ
ncbi:MAG: helix-turn-helix transcriptional regulator [Alphaproteobacteria bacterium]|nr:helix-turn-helix transcriptional regulator [Alphaproteobacteria bacterium]